MERRDPRGRLRGRNLVGIVTALSQLFVPATAVRLLASELPPEGRPRGTGIVRVGELAGRDMERAYALVEKRLARWLENQPALEARAKAIPGSVSLESLRGEEGRARLEAAVGRVESALVARQAVEPADRALVEGAVAGPSRRRLGSVAQRALFAEAALRYAERDREGAESAVREAVAMHPDGKVPGALGWDKAAEAPAVAAVESLMERAVSGLARQCRVHVVGLGEGSALSVNGFSVGTRRELLLAVPYEYLFEADGRERTVRCDRPGSRPLSLPLAGVGPASATELAAISQRQGVRSLVLVEPRRDQFRFWLFSPERAVEEIPLEAPLRVAEVLAAPSEASLPIATDAFVTLFARHRPPAGGGWAAVEEPPAPVLAGQRPGAEPSRWYNSTTFWVVVGGVAAGIATAVLLSRGEAPVKARPGVTIRLE